MTRRAAVADSSQQQLALPGFDAAAVAPTTARSHPPESDSPAALPRAGREAASSPVVPAHPVPIVPETPQFRHPRASRDIALANVVVGYELTRVRRRSIGMVVSQEGLSVRAPRWVSITDIETALREKAAWIAAKLVEQRERARRHENARIEWRDGASLPFLGETVILVLDPRKTGAVLNTDATALPGVPRLTLHVGLPHTASTEQIRDVVQAWLQRQARRVFEERCAHYAQRLGVEVRRMSLSSAQTRWGSASADGSIRLNWRLVHFAMPTIDYVVAHELAHLREMNHSPRFWDVVRSVIPDVDAVRGRLRDEVLPALD
ncbi:MAG TPA: SprT family zinc-dependent metalloprotease [Burkholderiaceae bacterium]|jgi:predicted metal-dependent hydrolase|nr:SprT family zinc-dependent metalloprotease [Burkholderiaceae bacterium]